MCEEKEVKKEESKEEFSYCELKILDFEIRTPVIDYDEVTLHQIQLGYFYEVKEYLKKGKLPKWYLKEKQDYTGDKK